MPDLVVVFLAVSCLSLVLQVVSFGRLAVQRAGSPTEKLVGDGYLRTIACRVLAATVYVVVAAVQLAGAGTLTGEALVVFASVQILWQLNSLADIAIRRKLGGGEVDSRTEGLRPDLRPMSALGDLGEQILHRQAPVQLLHQFREASLPL